MQKNKENSIIKAQSETLFQSMLYTPDSETKIHENAIKLLCAPFQSHENGLPEWIKNSADAYITEDFEEQKRVILIIFNDASKTSSSSISCLDLVGIKSYEIEEYFNYWGRPDAAGRGRKKTSIQGGHGNGGKCYMTQMFANYSYIHTVKDKIKNCYGVPGGSIKFGYIPDVESGKDVPIENFHQELENTLNSLGCSIKQLPRSAQNAIDLANGFSLITGFGPKGYEKKISIKPLIKNLKNHSQMHRTLELCKVYVIANGKIENEKKPLSLTNITPIKGAEIPRELKIPSKLEDAVSSVIISTTEEGKLHIGKLTLFTSEKSMKYSGMRSRHVIRFKGGESGDFGFVQISDLDIQSSYRDHIYGICELESLEQYKQNQRGRLAESPLVRSIERFISKKIQEYAKEFEAKDRRKYGHQEKNLLDKMNEALDEWKNRFINEFLKGAWGSGSDGPPPPSPPLPTGSVSRIELRLPYSKAGKGVIMRPILAFFDENGKRIQAVPHKWVSEDNNIALVDEDQMFIRTFSVGNTEIYAETLDGNIRSNTAPIEVIQIKKIKIFPEILELPLGSRHKLDAHCVLVDGSEIDEALLFWAENDKTVARVSPSGVVFGFKLGETEVNAMDENCSSENSAIIKIIEGKGRGKGDKPGKGYPRVLISEIHPDPFTKELVVFSSDDPPVLQRAEDADNNIWWINSASPLAKLYLDKDKYGFKSREWRMYHLERYIDIIVQILLIYSPDQKESFDVNEWIRKWMIHVSEIQMHAFFGLSDFIESGDMDSIEQ